MSTFASKLNEQIGYEFAASQQYIAIAVYYDVRDHSRSSRRTSTARRSRSGTTR